jgi:hypothetical protein
MLLFSSLALAANRQTTGGGGCCTLIFLGLFIYIYRAGGADWARAIGAAIFPGVFGWFIWRDRDLGTGSRWFALITASLHVFSFVVGLVLSLALRAGAFNGLLNIPNPIASDTSKPSTDLGDRPEDESLGLHPVSLIMSDPIGAKVFVNGEARGKTPLETPLAAGQRNEVKVELSGYFPATQDRSPNARERLTFNFTLKPAARLKVTSEPPGARVLSSMNEVLKHTPGVAEPLEVGETEVLVFLEGYQPSRQKMTLPVGESTLDVTLTPGEKLTVNSTPDKAEIYVDGLWAGITPADVYVAPKGKHTVEVKKESWATAKKVFTQVSKPTTFNVKLVDTDRVRAQAIVARARARYDKVNRALEKVQAKLEQMPSSPGKLERQLVALERDMEKAATELEKADADLKSIVDARNVGQPPPPPEQE